MSPALLLAAFCAATPASGQQVAETRQGTIERQVHVIGMVLATDIFRLKSTIAGRAEQVRTSTGVWAASDQSLGFLLNKEFAALQDAHSSTAKSVLEDRWKPVYRPTQVRCPYDCFVLKSFVRSKQWVKPRAVLFEAAAHLRMVGRVRPEDAHLVRDGMLLDYWDVKNPAKRFQTRVVHYVLDFQGEKIQPGGAFAMNTAIGPSQYLPPGTNWEGVIVPVRKTDAILAPTNALIRFGGELYLPVKVFPGITTPNWTEIEAGVEAKRKILIFSDEQLRQAQRHKVEVDFAALRRRVYEESNPPEAAGGANPNPRENVIEDIREPDSDLGEDPYSE